MHRLLAVLMLGASADVMMRYYDVNAMLAEQVPKLAGNTNTALLAFYTVMIMVCAPRVVVKPPKVDLSKIKIPEPKLPDKISVDLSKAEPAQIQALAHVITRAGSALAEVDVIEKLVALRQGMTQINSLVEDVDISEMDQNISTLVRAANKMTELEEIDLPTKALDLSILRENLVAVHELVDDDDLDFDEIDGQIDNLVKVQNLFEKLKES